MCPCTPADSTDPVMLATTCSSVETCMRQLPHAQSADSLKQRHQSPLGCYCLAEPALCSFAVWRPTWQGCAQHAPAVQVQQQASEKKKRMTTHTPDLSLRHSLMTLQPKEAPALQRAVLGVSKAYQLASLEGGGGKVYNVAQFPLGLSINTIAQCNPDAPDRSEIAFDEFYIKAGPLRCGLASQTAWCKALAAICSRGKASQHSKAGPDAATKADAWRLGLIMACCRRRAQRVTSHALCSCGNVVCSSGWCCAGTHCPSSRKGSGIGPGSTWMIPCE